MLISLSNLKEKIEKEKEVFCSGLHKSARWFAVSEAAQKGVNLVVLPDRETAEYCAADLYNLVEGDNVFFMPDSGRSIEKSNYKSSLAVQRTSSIGKMVQGNIDSPLFVVSYPSALEENVPDVKSISNSILKLSVGQEIDPISIRDILFEAGFEKVDFVSEPGHCALRGGIVDIFSYSSN
jgi:transcription-repair coupling factor (superfamily II helicase)